jgi:RNA polymerase sigma-70 factor (ECF subfamily)
MNDRDWLDDRFEQHRARLRSVAFRILGSTSDADDAVQEAWIRLHRADASSVDNLGGWLTTVVSRVCLDMLRARSVRPEPAEPQQTDLQAQPAAEADPEYEAMLSDSVGLALLVVMDTLSPAERLAFVLHDMFGVPFDEIADVLGASTTAARQHASRARRRVQGGTGEVEADATRRHEIVDAFLAASRNGEFGTLISLLHPEAALRADAVALAAGADEAVGAARVAESFAGRAKAAELAVIDGEPGVVWRQRGTPRAAFVFTIDDDQITGIELLMNPDTLEALDVVMVN